MKPYSLPNLFKANKSIAFFWAFSLVIGIACIIGYFHDQCPLWLSFIALFGFFGCTHLLVRKKKLMKTWPYIYGDNVHEDIVINVWSRNYRRTWFYQDFIKWYTPRKKNVWTIMLWWFIVGFACAFLNIYNFIHVVIPTMIFGAWFFVVLSFAVTLFIDKFLTFLSISTIKEILHERGINYRSGQELINDALKVGFELK